MLTAVEFLRLARGQAPVVLLGQAGRAAAGVAALIPVTVAVAVPMAGLGQRRTRKKKRCSASEHHQAFHNRNPIVVYRLGNERAAVWMRRPCIEPGCPTLPRSLERRQLRRAGPRRS